MGDALAAFIPLEAVASTELRLFPTYPYPSHLLLLITILYLFMGFITYFF
jgi:hypothetical protein